MITKELIERINQLARKKRTVGLSDEELVEQQQLRKQYLSGIRAQLKAQLDRIIFVDADDPRLQQQTHYHIHSCGCEAHGDSACGCDSHNHSTGQRGADESFSCGCGNENRCGCESHGDHGECDPECGCKHVH